MATNLWTQELVRTGLKTTATTGNARWVDRNGEMSMELRPNVFYASSVYGELMSGSFKPNTAYCFDLWIDGDEMGLAGYTNPSGLNIFYTSNTASVAKQISVNGVSGSTQGFLHRRWISDPTKTILKVNVVYHRGYNWYARWDSSVSEVEEIEFNKNGIASTGQWKENGEELQPTKGGIVSSFNLVEY